MGESNPSFLPWKGSVLTDRRIEHGGSFLQELPNLLAWEVCRRVATSSAMLASCVWIHTRLIEDFWINYYTSTNLARQELFCNLLVIFQLATSEIRSLCLTLGEPMLAWVFGFTTVPQWSPSGVCFFHFIDEFYISHEFTTTPHLITLQSKVILKYYWKWEWESNPRTTVLQTATLPFCHLTILARHAGIEPTFVG